MRSPQGGLSHVDATAAMFEQRLKDCVTELRREFAELPASHVLHQLARDDASAAHIDRLLHEAVENVLAAGQETVVRTQQAEIAALRQEAAAARGRQEEAEKGLRGAEAKLAKLRQREAGLLRDVSELERRLHAAEGALQERDAAVSAYQTRLEHAEETYEQLQHDFKATHKAFMTSLTEQASLAGPALGADDLHGRSLLGAGGGGGVSFLLPSPTPEGRRSRSAQPRGRRTDTLFNTTLQALNTTSAPHAVASAASAAPLLSVTRGGGAAHDASSAQLAADATLQVLHAQLPEVRQLRARVAGAEQMVKQAKGAVASVLTVLEGAAGGRALLTSNASLRPAHQPTPSAVVVERLAGCCQGLLDACGVLYHPVEEEGGVRRLADSRFVVADMAEGLKATHRRLKQSLKDQAAAGQAVRAELQRELAEKTDAHKRAAGELDRYRRQSEMAASELQGIREAKKEADQEERLSKLLSSQIESALHQAGIAPPQPGPAYPHPHPHPAASRSHAYTRGPPHPAHHDAASGYVDPATGTWVARELFSAEHHISRVEHLEALRAAESGMLNETRSYVAEKERALAAEHAKQAAALETKVERAEAEKKALQEQIAAANRETHDAKRERDVEANRRTIAEQAVAVLKSDNARSQQQLVDKLSEFTTTQHPRHTLPSGLATPGFDQTTPYHGNPLGSPGAGGAQDAAHVMEQLGGLVNQTTRAVMEGLMNVSVECNAMGMNGTTAAEGYEVRHNSATAPLHAVAVAVAEAQNARDAGVLLHHMSHSGDGGWHRVAQSIHAELTGLRSKVQLLAKSSGVFARYVGKYIRCAHSARAVAAKVRGMARAMGPLRRAVETLQDGVEQDAAHAAGQITAAIAGTTGHLAQLSGLHLSARVGSLLAGVTPFLDVPQRVQAALADASLGEQDAAAAVREWDEVLRGGLVPKAVHEDIVARCERAESECREVSAEYDTHARQAAAAASEADGRLAAAEQKTAALEAGLAAAEGEHARVAGALDAQQAEVGRLSKEAVSLRAENERLTDAHAHDKRRYEDDAEAAAAALQRGGQRVEELEALLEEERGRVREALDAHHAVNRAEVNVLESQRQCLEEAVARLKDEKDAKAAQLEAEQREHADVVAELELQHKATLARLQSEAALNERLAAEKSDRDKELARLSLRCDRTLSVSRQEPTHPPGMGSSLLA